MISQHQGVGKGNKRLTLCGPSEGLWTKWENDEWVYNEWKRSNIYVLGSATTQPKLGFFM